MVWFGGLDLLGAVVSPFGFKRNWVSNPKPIQTYLSIYETSPADSHGTPKGTSFWGQLPVWVYGVQSKPIQGGSSQVWIELRSQLAGSTVPPTPLAIATPDRSLDSGVVMSEEEPLIGGTCEQCIAPCETCFSATALCMATASFLGVVVAGEWPCESRSRRNKQTGTREIVRAEQATKEGQEQYEEQKALYQKGPSPEQNHPRTTRCLGCVFFKKKAAILARSRLSCPGVGLFLFIFLGSRGFSGWVSSHQPVEGLGPLSYGKLAVQRVNLEKAGSTFRKFFDFAGSVRITSEAFRQGFFLFRMANPFPLNRTCLFQHRLGGYKREVEYGFALLEGNYLLSFKLFFCFCLLAWSTFGVCKDVFFYNWGRLHMGMGQN